ncbi:SlyX family protein [Dyella mobilis]|uniref:SlyX family protein n=1 Tax=Dyella mobilis TaxID=1849582 RepID=A0ABS2KJ29_9GAMM|nr:SlyX family protein [Dyella mobilis]MBM7130939.1 SlyX family protein [Dyella mobilis]GLQ97568.1 protein SlyX [Dyella mobilis]
MSNLEQRLTELEVRLTFIDEAVQALTAADADQSLRLVELERLVRDLRNELATVRTGQGHDPHSEPPPPHY